METLEKHNQISLSAQLYRMKVPYLRELEEYNGQIDLSHEQLIYELASNGESRVQEALIPLFLRYPELASLLPNVLETLPIQAQSKLKHFYTAAVYLQRLWQTRLLDSVGKTPMLIDLFGQSEFGLAEPNQHYGELGLRQLAEIFTEETGFDWYSVYESILESFLQNLRIIYYD